MIWVLIWYIKFPIFSALDIFSNEVIASIIVISIIYIIGMLIDFLGKWFTSKIETIIEKYFPSKRIRKYQVKCSHADIVHFSSELGKEMEMRSSRDRIARGAIINCAIITLTLVFEFQNDFTKWTAILIFGIILFLSFLYMWMRFQRLSNKFRHHCDILIEKKETLPNNSS